MFWEGNNDARWIVKCKSGDRSVLLGFNFEGFLKPLASMELFVVLGKNDK